MAAALFSLPPYRSLGSASQVLSGAKLYWYLSSTTTAADTWSDPDQADNHRNANPVVADSGGLFGPIWLSVETAYRYILTTSAGVTLVTQDNVYPGAAGQFAVNIKGYGATGDGVTDDSAAIQAAIDTAQDVYAPPGTYACHGLTLNNTFQVLFGDGGWNTAFVKNADGPILTVSGNACQLFRLTLRGDSATPAFTGDNLVVTANDVKVIKCNSRWCTGRAVWAPSAAHLVIDTGEYSTTDVSATGYEIEIGQAGVVTAYCRLINLRSSLATGGIHFIDTGGQSIVTSQFGKLWVDKSGGPSGSNGGEYLGNRILGAVVVEMSSAVFAGNHFSSVPITFASGTSACTLDTSNRIDTGAVVTNNGNTNNFIARETSTGSVSQLKFGDDSSAMVLEMNLAAGTMKFPGKTILPNAVSYTGLNSTASEGWRLGQTSGNIVQLVNEVASGVIQLDTTGAGALINLMINAVVALTINNTGVRIPNVFTLQLNQASGAVGSTLGVTAGDTLELKNLVTDEAISIQTTDSGAGAGLISLIGGSSRLLDVDPRGWLRIGGTGLSAAAGPKFLAGSGSPEGAVTAPIGSLYLRTDSGGSGDTVWSKNSGTSNTGWAALT